ncbi:hypothetical protein [Nocardioides cynanchi]|uniref:hypothetical protein n=1 Tax=Nocardioides cynanchi TaxID=2558918 RepID=UPI001247C8DE|nr:hypothetical protein [Nocardioides cynanchi]
MRRLPAIVPASALALALLAPAPPAEATFVPEGRPTLAGFSHLVVDEAHSHLFFSQGSAGAVVVTDLSGVTSSTLATLDGATDLVLAPTGDTVWVALPTGAAVAAVDTVDLSVTTYAIGSGTCPSRLAVVDGKVWTVAQCGSAAAELYRLTPGTGSVADLGAIATGTLVAGSPQLPGVLVTARPTDVGATLEERDVATTPAQPTIVATNDLLPSMPLQIAVSADGQRVVTSRGFVYRSSDLSLGRDRGDPGVDTALAVRADGQIAYGDLRTVHGFRLPGGSAMVDVPLSPAHLLADGLGYGAHDVYAVTSDSTGFGVTPLQLRLPTAFRVVLDSARVRYGHPVGVSVTAPAAPVGAPINLYAKQQGSPARLVAQGGLDSGLRFDTSYVVKADATLTATFAGDADWAPWEAQASVSVRPDVAMALSGQVKVVDGSYVYRSGSKVHVVATALPRDTRGCVRVRLQVKHAGRWRPYAPSDCVRVSARGKVTESLGHTAPLRGVEARVSSWLFDHPDDVAEAHSAWTPLTFVR